MKQKFVFSFNSYKDLMAYFLTGKTRHGELTKAAKALNCQRSYLSRVISENLHITPDHAFNLALFLRFSPHERDYFLSMVEYERSGDKNYREFIMRRLQDLKQKNESIAERTERKTLSFDGHQATYFSSWIWSAIHFLTSIPEYQNSDRIAERIGLNNEAVLIYLRSLEAQGFVVQENQKWKYHQGEFHAQKNSPLVLLHHQNWRMRAMIDAQNFDSESVHFTAVQTMSRKDATWIKELLLSFISEASLIAGPSSPEDGIVLACDFFKI